ncbi:MAG: hypothetical protein KF866_01935 [Phycisphaeraceae bacterium]|nr:hypothetical protein [Phycisphaeraceae bacterium]MCW5753547.1 hypothetical protein [Phycisphaeraceae bacterium]
MSNDASRRRLLAVALPMTAIPGLFPRRTSNPLFQISPEKLAHEISRLRSDPQPLRRPVVVLAGWRSPMLVSLALSERLSRLTSGNPSDFLALAYPWKGCIEAVVRHVALEIASRFPGSSTDETSEIDIVAHSMGGLVARAASAGMVAPAPRVRIARLFTLGTPHRGAKLARAIAPDAASRAMKPGSAWLASLDAHHTEATYELVCYAHLNDRWVGARNTAPPGRDPIWTAGTMAFSHFSVTEDRQILVDIARRLRGEPPLAEGPSPPPRD